MLKKIETYKKNRKGFSLLEISVVILIIGILIAGISQASDMIDEANLKSARTASKGSRVSRIRDLVLWLDGTAEGTTLTSSEKQAIDGQSVANWRDSNPGSANRLSLTGVSPAYNSSKTGGLPSVYFSGSQYLKLATKYDNSTDEYTIYLVYQPFALPASGSTSVIMEKRSATPSTSYPFKLELEGTGFYKLSDSNTFIYGTKKASTGKVNLIRLSRSSSGSLMIVVDDVSASSNAISTSVRNSDELIIGAQNGAVPSNYINGRIGELVIFERDLSPKEEGDIEIYLYKKWKIEKDSSKSAVCVVTTPNVAVSTISVGSNISISCTAGYVGTITANCTAAPALAYSVVSGSCVQGCLVSSSIFTVASTIAVGGSTTATCKGGTTRTVTCPTAGNPTFTPACP